MKKIISLIMALLILISGTAILSACNTKPTTSDMPSDGGKDETGNEKVELLFLMDEGISGKGLTTKYKDDLDQMDEYFSNMIEAVEPLTEKYDVSFLIYPNWHYSENGYGGDASNPLNRISNELKHTLQYFSNTQYGIYLEAYSSGVYTNQNGELGNLPLVPLHYGDTETVKSLPLDMEALDALMQAYPSVRGVRFHELIGSNIQAGNGHGFEVDVDTIYAIADVVEKNNKTLVWGDHSWTLVYNDYTQEWWQEVIEKVSEQLGENLIINFNNNSRYVLNSIKLKDIMDDGKYGRRWGLSNQSWFWSEAEVVMGNDWYEDSEIDMPAELSAVFTLDAINRGASMVQFEPVGYFFNCNYSGESAPDQTGYNEGIPDFTATLKFDKVKEFLLADNYDNFPSLTVADYYASSESSLNNNLELQKPKKYYQTTIGVFGETDTEYFNKYSSDADQTYTYETPYFRERVTDRADKIMRINLSYNQFDQYLVKKTVNGNAVAQIYSDTNALLYEDAQMFADNTDGTFVDAVAINLVSELGFDGDSDEIVVFRKAGSVITPTVYKLRKVSNVNVRKAFAYEPNDALTETFRQEYGTDFTTDTFVDVLGIRTRNARLLNGTRPLDSVIVITKQADKLVLNGAVGDYSVQQAEIPLPENFVGAFACDVNLDCVDEIAIVHGSSIKFYYFEGSEIYNTGTTLETGIENIQYAESFRKTTSYIAL